MYGALLLAGAFLWLFFAMVAGWVAYRCTKKRWTQVVSSLLFVWLPFWDVVPGLYFYYKAVREVGGVHIYKTVRAEGYLDLTVTDCYSCWSQIDGSPYSYIEVLRTTRGLQFPNIETGPGYYEYQLLSAGDSACQPFESLPNAARIMRRRGISGNCLAITRRDYPMSQYEVSVSTAQLPFGPKILSRRVRDRAADALLAESNQVYFTSWLGRQVGLPHWQHTEESDGTHIGILNIEVMAPE